MGDNLFTFVKLGAALLALLGVWAGLTWRRTGKSIDWEGEYVMGPPVPAGQHYDPDEVVHVTGGGTWGYVKERLEIGSVPALCGYKLASAKPLPELSATAWHCPLCIGVDRNQIDPHQGRRSPLGQVR